jgi:hypothetical protein
LGKSKLQKGATANCPNEDGQLNSLSHSHQKFCADGKCPISDSDYVIIRKMDGEQTIHKPDSIL